MSEKERREKLELAKKVATEVPEGMKRPPGYEMLDTAVVNGRQCIYYFNAYRHPNYYVRTIRCEEDLEPWK